VDEKYKYRRYIAYFDMLGMEPAVDRNMFEAMDALHRIDQSKELISQFGLYVESLNKKITVKDQIKFFIFSDTIIAYSYKDEIEDLWAILFYASEMFCQTLHRKVPLRGSVTLGNFIFDLEKNFFLGPALNEAYTIAENTQWLGVCLSDDVAQNCIESNIRGGDKDPLCVEWNTPKKDMNIQGKYVLNWLATHKHNFLVKPPLSPEVFYQFKDLFGEYDSLSEDIKKKYQNTVNFINEMFKVNV